MIKYENVICVIMSVFPYANIDVILLINSYLHFRFYLKNVLFLRCIIKISVEIDNLLKTF